MVESMKGDKPLIELLLNDTLLLGCPSYILVFSSIVFWS